MDQIKLGSFRNRVHQARRTGDLYFASLITRECIELVFGEASSILNSARVYNTAVTVWVFLSQVMSMHHGCVSAVAKLIAYRVACGLKPCSSQTGAYCIARDQLDEQAMHRLVTHSGRAIEDHAPDAWLWLGHRVVIADGTTLTMADTPANQAAYPQLKAQAPGCGFPMMGVVVLFALSTGVVLEAALGKYKGKLTHEVSLFRAIDSGIGKDDIFLADRAYSGWFEMARMRKRRAHFVIRKHQIRSSDFRTGKRLGPDDHLIHLDRPVHPKWMSEKEYQTYPPLLIIRETRIRIENKGFRTREIIVHSSLLDDAKYTKENVAELFRRRWHAELNLGSLKTIMQMEHLRCKEPHRVRNELRAHLMAYNLVRQVMTEAASEGQVEPWQISFKATLSTISDMLPVLGIRQQRNELSQVMLICCVKHVVGNRPDRFAYLTPLTYHLKALFCHNLWRKL